MLRESRYATVAQQTEEAERDADHQVLIPQEIVFHGGKEIISWLREYLAPLTTHTTHTTHDTKLKFNCNC